MPVTPTYPGVYVQELPSGVRTITGVPTSITAFLGRAARGPINEPVTISNFGEFERIFGGLQLDSPMTYAVQDFFNNGGGQAIITRLFKPPADPPSSEELKTKQGELATAQEDLEAKIAALKDDPKAPAAVTEAQKNLAKAETQANKDPAVKEAQKEYDAKAKALQEADAADEAAFVRLAGEVAEAKAALDQARANIPDLAQAQAALDVALAQVPDIVAADVKVRHLQDTVADLERQAAITASGTAQSDNSLNLIAASPGRWGNNLRVLITAVADETGEVLKAFGYQADDQLFNLSVFEGDPTEGAPVERIQNVSLTEGKRRIDRVLDQESLRIRVQMAGGEPVLPPDAKFTAPEDALTFAGGADSASLDSKLDWLGSLDAKTGLYALEKADLFNLLCIPPDTRAGNVIADIYADVLNYCQQRRAMLIVDPPIEWAAIKETAAARAKSGLSDLQIQGEAARNAALYFPRVVKADPLRDGQPDVFPACGIIAGVMARTDAGRGVWKAPAGIDATLNGIRSLQANLTDAETGQLNPLGVNCLRTFPNLGHVIWGARTRRGADQLADDYKYVPIRRLALFIEETLYRSTQWAVFEPNDEPLWAELRLNIGVFMHDLFRQGAFQGQKPGDAYFVKCDSETTTQSDINKGIVNIIVGFAPLKPAEFVIIYLQQMAGHLQS